MKYLTKEQMEKLPTPRLVNYFKKYLRAVPYEYWDSKSVDALSFGENWKKAREIAKAILATRPHVEKKKSFPRNL